MRAINDETGTGHQRGPDDAAHDASWALRDWLDDADHPVARYLLARDIDGVTGPPLADLKQAAVAWPPLQDVLALQQADGRFPNDEPHAPAAGTFGALRLMARCGMSVTDEPVSRALAFLETSHASHGALSHTSGGAGILPCYLGLVTRALIGMGALDSATVQASLAWIVAHQRFDIRDHRAGGEEPWPFRSVVNYGCWESVSCYHGVVGALGALSAVPASKRTDAQRTVLSDAVDYLRPHRVYKRTSQDKPLFASSTRFALFTGYRSHLVDVLERLAEADPALASEEWVAAAVRDVDALAPGGRLVQDAGAAVALTGGSLLEPAGEPSRLLTLQWLRTKALFGLPLAPAPASRAA